MPQLAFTGRQPAANLAQRLGPAQLAEQHGDELSPTAAGCRAASRAPAGAGRHAAGSRAAVATSRKAMTRMAAPRAAACAPCPASAAAADSPCPRNRPPGFDPAEDSPTRL